MSHDAHVEQQLCIHSENTDSRDSDFKVSHFICQCHQEAHKLIPDIKETTQCEYVSIYNVKHTDFNLMCNIKFDVDANTISLIGHVTWRHYSQALGT